MTKAKRKKGYHTMIEMQNLSKSFDQVLAVNNVSLTVREGEVFGLIGTNGAGKSTLLRILSGVLRQDSGTVLLDERPVYDSPAVKQNLFFIPDNPYFLPNSTPAQMRDYYMQVYPGFDRERFDRLAGIFRLDPSRRIHTFSKGMKKQLAVLLGLSSRTKYLFCDETFDGLDPVMRQSVKTLFAEDMEERGLTPVIASHNLRELEDVCDHVGLLHQGGVLLSEDLSEMKSGIRKIQCVFQNEADAELLPKKLPLVSREVRGRLHTLTVRANEEEIRAFFSGTPTVFFEILPLTLEEIFISETEGAGYDIKKLLLD